MQLASATVVSSRCTVAWACAGAISVAAIRCSMSATSVSSDWYFRRKNASASSGLPAAHEPITRSPSAVRTKTVPASSTRPHGSVAVVTANLLWFLCAPVPKSAMCYLALLDRHAVDDDLLLGYAPAGLNGAGSTSFSHILENIQT